jgi:hypothetical protein
VGIFSNEDGILSMEDSAGRQGLGLRKEITRFMKRIPPFAGQMNKNSVIVHLDDDGSYENVPCSQKDEMQHFRALYNRVKGRFAAATDELLNKIREHLNKYTVRYLHCSSFFLRRVYLYLCPFYLLDLVDYRNVKLPTLFLHQWWSGVRVVFWKEPFGSLPLDLVREGIAGVSYQSYVRS